MSEDDIKTTGEQGSLLESFIELKNSGSTSSRLKLVDQICQQYTSKEFSDKEQQIVNEIISILSQDVEKKIRQSVAENLKDSEDLPHEVAMRLAADEEEISTPILQFSNVLTDMDLQMLVRSTNEVMKLKAVAQRQNVSETVASELVEKGKQEVTETLLKNKTAEISDDALEKVAEDFGKSEETMALLISRGGLNVGLVERLISNVSEALQKQLSEEYKIDPELARQKVAGAREEMTLNVVGQASSRSSVEMVNHLHSSGKLTQSIVLRAICRGDIKFFEAGMARLAGIPITNASRLLEQANEKAFEALFSAASMPETVREGTFVVLQLVYDLRDEGLMERSDFFIKAPRLLIERIVDKDYNHTVANMSYLMALITNIAEENDRKYAKKAAN